MKGIIRPVRLSDAGEISRIYAPYVENTAISFEYAPPGELEMAGRITETSHKYPYLVYENEGGIVGYAYASAYNPREAYAWTAVSSIYLSSGCQRVGVGSALYGALFDLLDAQGFFNVLAIIVYPHEQSIAFHKKHGFASACVLSKCGYKFNTWHDVIIMEKKLKREEHPVGNVILFSNLDEKLVNGILEKHNNK